MKEIFIREKDMPKSCYGCSFRDGENGRCQALNEFVVGDCVPRICQLKSLEQLKQEVRKEFAEKLKADIEKAIDSNYELKQYEVGV